MGGGGVGRWGEGEIKLLTIIVYIASKADLYRNRSIICHDLTPNFGS
jgi:hypothetical protein